LVEKLDRAGIRYKRQKDFFSGDTDDQVLLRSVGKKNWIFITFDKKQRTRMLERRLIGQFKIREFVFTSNEIGDPGELLVKASREMRAICKKIDGPFVATISKAGKVHLRPENERGL
jgi:hypothetical protein